MALAANDDLYRLRHFDAHILRDPGVEHVGRPNAESDASDCADVRRVRIGSDVDLAWECVGLEHHRVANALGAFAVGEFAMQLNSLLFGEILLL